MIRTVIVEDEPLARDLLRSYLALHSDVDLVGEATDGRSGLALVKGTAPDLVLLDIHLPEMSGVELARQIKRDVSLIFITAHDAYAMTAFELGVFDYLLKPVLPERFATALGRIRERRATGDVPELLGDRLSSVFEGTYLQHFFVRHLGTLLPVHVTDIVRLESDDDYTAVYARGKRLMVHLPLREMASRLNPQSFVRVHRCDIVNLAHVKHANQTGRRILLQMSDGSEVSSSRAGLQALQALHL